QAGLSRLRVAFHPDRAEDEQDAVDGGKKEQEGDHNHISHTQPPSRTWNVSPIYVFGQEGWYAIKCNQPPGIREAEREAFIGNILVVRIVVRLVGIVAARSAAGWTGSTGSIRPAGVRSFQAG